MYVQQHNFLRGHTKNHVAIFLEILRFIEKNDHLAPPPSPHGRPRDLRMPPYENDGEKCLPPKMKSQWLFKMSHLHIEHPVCM